MTDEPGTPLTEQRREELLEGVSRRGATIGQQIPETVTIDGEEIRLREFVWETKEQGFVPAEYLDRVQKVRSKLNAERDRRKERLAGAELTTAEAERLADSIVGIDRAIAALRSLREQDLGEQKREEEIADSRRWIGFLDQLR